MPRRIRSASTRWKIERKITTILFVIDRTNEWTNFFFFFSIMIRRLRWYRWSKGGEGLREGSPWDIPPSSSKHVCAGWDRSKRNSSIPDNSSLLNSSYSLVRLVSVERQSSCKAVRDSWPIPSMPIKIVDGLIERVARLASPRKRRSISSSKDNRRRNGQVYIYIFFFSIRLLISSCY